MNDKRKELSPSDEKELARLVGTYGRDFIVAAAKRVRPRRAGRSKSFWDRPDLVPPSDWNRWEQAAWIEERTEELRAAGQTLPLQRSMAELFTKSVPKEKQTDDELRKFEKRIKNARNERSRVERLIKNARAKRPSNATPISRPSKP